MRLDQLAHFKHVRERLFFVDQQVRQRPDQRFHRQVDEKLPMPVRLTISPWLSNARRASRTEVRLTLKISASSRSDGS